jgi:hypothetical protein
MLKLVAGIAVVAVTSSGMVRIERTPAASPLLRPGSTDLTGSHFAARCDSVWFVSRRAGDTTGRLLTVRRLTERVTTYRGKPAVLLVTQVRAAQPYVDSALVYRDGLAPIWETSRSGTRVTRYTYDANRVRIAVATGDSTPATKEHRYDFPVFNFQELDAVIRSLPLRQGYEALLPLYSEGDDSVEVDSVRVESRGANGVWRIRFADPAVIATVGVDGKSRAQVAYSHTFRQNGPSWKAGTVWRREYAACATQQSVRRT